jgi:hypothetical protein
MILTPTAVLIALVKTAITVALCFAAADLLVGAVHWAEDSYGQEHWPVVGPLVIAPNLLHHAEPRALLANSWWTSANLQVVAGGAVLGGALLLGWFSWPLALVIVLAVNGNEVHKWAHRTRAENGRLITWLQDLKLIQGRAHHGRHHGGDRNTHYCALTCWMDRGLEALRFWRGLEWLIAKATGTVPRIDPAVLARRARAALTAG